MTPAAADATRTRLLEIAGPLFAARGFRDTGVKEICDAADCNVAAINYHFGSKQEFYADVLAHAHRSAFTGSPMPAPDPALSPEREFATWLRWWMGALLHQDRPTWLQTLMAREMVDPTPALDQMVERSIRPMYERLTAIVRRLLPKGCKASIVRDCTNSVAGQVLFYKHAAPVITRLQTMPSLDARGLDQLVDHVVRFSLAGIAAAVPPRKQNAPR